MNEVSLIWRLVLDEREYKSSDREVLSERTLLIHILWRRDTAIRWKRQLFVMSAAAKHFIVLTFDIYTHVEKIGNAGKCMNNDET